jgi:uncharacterized Zn finger protein
MANQRHRVFGESWLGRLWVIELEKLTWGSRLARGKSYVRQGRVLALEVVPGVITAKVRGTHVRPYTVSIYFAVWNDADLAVIAGEVKKVPMLLGQLLSGQLSRELLTLMEELELPVLPSDEYRADFSCSCPEWGLCKHVAAAWYLFADEIDRDPMVLLEMHGLDATRLATLLESAIGSETADEPASASLPIEPHLFWQYPHHSIPEIEPSSTPPASALLLRRMGNPPYWSVGTDLEILLREVYNRSSQTAVQQWNLWQRHKEQLANMSPDDSPNED